MMQAESVTGRLPCAARRLVYATVTALLAVQVGWPLIAVAGDTSVAEEILDILRDSKQISPEKYEELHTRRAKEEAGTLRAYWKDGLRFGTADKRFNLQIGGRIQNDWAWLDPDDGVQDNLGLSDPENGTEFRSARLYLAGEIHETVEFKIQYDFADGQAAFKDVFVGMKKLPVVQHVRVGHIKEPFSLEELTSSKYATFMERGLSNVFAPSRNTGIGVDQVYLDERLTWAAGGFRETDDFGDGFGSDSMYNLTTRLTGLPYFADGGGKLLHLGLSYSHKFRNDDAVRFRERPEAHLSPVRFVDTRDISANGVDLINPEVAFVYGPFSLQGEYVHAFVDVKSARDPDFDGYYAYVSYFLTGEHRNYKTSEAAFDKVAPNRNFLGADGGCGAWEAAVRYSNLDLNDIDTGIRGYKLDDITFGLNWYLNPNVRITFNYVFADQHPFGNTNIFQGRFQLFL